MNQNMPMQLPEAVFQFGTGKFLRCFADLFIHEANQTTRPVGRIAVLQSTGTARAKTFHRQGGRYHAAIRGLERGRRIDRTVEVCSVSRALTAAEDWEEVLALGRCESLQAIVSNTTEAGYALEPGDLPDHRPPQSFPAKLLLLLQARYESGGRGVAVLPCELLENNAERLIGLVLDQARSWDLSEDFMSWLREECSWHNTLVDRIVSAPKDDDPLAAADPLFAVAEPFAQWLIEGSPPVPGLVEHPAVQLVEQIAPYHLRKVRILNGAHTALVAKAIPLGITTVREAVSDAEIGRWLNTLLFEEIVPVLEGRTDDPAQFARDTLERFANPFLEHRLADIALHHEVKVKTRLAPTYEEFQRQFGRVPGLLHELLSAP